MGYHLSNKRVPVAKQACDACEGECEDSNEPLNTHLVPNWLHPDYNVTMRVVPLERQLAAEDQRLRQAGEAAIPSFNGKECASMSFVRSLLTIIAAGEGGGRCTSDGQAPEKAFCVLVAGGGFQITAKSTAVRLGIALVSTTGLNQSPHDWVDFLLYSEEIRAYFDDVAEEVRSVGANGYVEDDTGKRYYVDLIIGGDKPWMLAFLGHRNMNFTFAFPYCKHVPKYLFP
eukprot:6210665-Pleurochrysis_carterae.AAC.5